MAKQSKPVPEGASDIKQKVEYVTVYRWKCPLIAVPSKQVQHPRGMCKYNTGPCYNIGWALSRKKRHLEKHANAKKKIEKWNKALYPEVNKSQ